MSLFSKTKPVQKASALLDINAFLGQCVDRRRDSLYDRVRLRAGQQMPSCVRCFLVPVGGPDQFDHTHVKTFADTNMWQSAQLNPPHDMIVSAFLLLFQPGTSDADRDALLYSYHWEFHMLDRIMAKQPVAVNSAIGEPGAVIDNFAKGTWLNDEGRRTDDSESVIQRVARGIAWELGEYAKFLPPLVYFSVELHGEPFRLQADFDMYVMLDGLRDYAVQ